MSREEAKAPRRRRRLFAKGGRWFALASTFGRFVFVGIIGFAVDAGGTWLLVRAGLPPLAARAPALAAAMLTTWLLHRRLTFNVEAPKTGREAARFFVVASTSALANYGLYSALVIAGVAPVLAVAFATVLLLVFSFMAYRIAVFR